MSIETIIKRATAEHIVVQGREDALRALIIAETTEQGLTMGMDYREVAKAAELAGLDRHGLTIVTAPEPDKTQVIDESEPIVEVPRLPMRMVPTPIPLNDAAKENEANNAA